MSEPRDESGRALIVVYRGHPRSVETACERFERAGLTPYVLDRATIFSRITSLGTLRIRLAVPEEDEDRAGEIIESWEEESARRVERSTPIALRQLALALLVPMAYLAWILLSGGELTVRTAVVAGVLLLVALAVTGRAIRFPDD